MRYLLILFMVIIGYSAPAQTSFNQAYDFGALAVGFGSLELSGDTLVVYGTALEEGQPTFGMLFARFDTSGNLLDYRIHYDSLGDHFTTVFPNSFIKLSDGSGYVGVGQFFNSQNGYFARFDHHGELINFVAYSDNYYTNNISREVIETNDGYLICGTNYSPSTSIEVFIQKTGLAGNKIWKKEYGANDKRDLFGSIFKLDNDELVIGASSTSINGVPLPQTRNTSKIFAIDSLGNIKWQWESQPSLEELGVGSLFKTQEDHWAYTSARGWYNATYNEISRQPKFIIRDEDFNIIRDDTFGVADFPVNGFQKGISLNDGGWLAIGVKPVHYPIPPVPMWYNSFSGWMVRLDNQGDQVWNRVDTAFWSYETGSTNYYYDAVELLSGSLVVCGYSRTYEPVVKDWGWLIKVSKDGCLDTIFCAPLSSSPWSIPEKSVHIYPNPTSSTVCIESEGIGLWDRIEVYNASGQWVQTNQGGVGNNLDLSKLSDGVYLLRLVSQGAWIVKRIVKHSGR
ncbi:MAG: T9SS type A sorting domain-containing protein [Saprospiraceae bacterium]|nr:T9SS type A sorting domain-containing protein [Saprospiraceae bacterium]